MGPRWLSRDEKSVGPDNRAPSAPPARVLLPSSQFRGCNMSFSSLSSTILLRNGALLPRHPSSIPTFTGAPTRSALTAGWKVLLSGLTRNLWSDTPVPPSQREAILHRTVCLWAASREVQERHGKKCDSLPACPDRRYGELSARTRVTNCGCLQSAPA